jgi:DNA-binding transcriptional LysR family regulator
MGEVEAAESELSAMNKHPRGRLKVGLPLAAGLPLPLISDFMERYPEIESDLDFSDRVADVINDGLDVVIRGGELIDSRLVSKRLGSYRVCLVATPGYLAARGTPSKPSDLATHSCLHYRYPTSGKLEEWPMRRSCSRGAGVTVPMTMVASSLIALLHLVQDGRGVACVPDFSVKDALAEGRLESVLDSYMTRSVVFHILWPTAKRMTPKVRAFVDFVVERFESELANGAMRKIYRSSKGALLPHERTAKSKV